MKLAIAGAAAALVAWSVPASAQLSMGGGKEASPVEQQYQQELKDRQEIDRQYRESVKRNVRATSDTANDPWALVRSTEQPAKKPR